VLLACNSGVGQAPDPKEQRSNVVAALCYLLDTVKPLGSQHFLHGAPGSRAYSACLAVIPAALCWNQQRLENWLWGADAEAWELVLGRVLPRLRDLQATAHLLALGGARDTQQQESQQQQQQRPPQQQATHEQAISPAQEQGEQHEGQADQTGEGDGQASRTTSEHGHREPPPAAAGSGGDVSRRPDVCPPADLALLLLMAAARTVKAGVAFHCFGMYCSSCDLWHPRRPVREESGSDTKDEGEGNSSSATADEHLLHKGQPNASCDGSSVAGSSGQPKQVDQSTGRTQLATPGLKDIEHDQLEEALDILLTLVHCLVVRGAWWQQAVSRHPLLLLQVLTTAADVSPGNDGRQSIQQCTRGNGDCAACLPSHLTGLQLLLNGCISDACRHCLRSQSTS
jgi:hypothetical protein